LAQILTAERFEAALTGVYAKHFTPAELQAVLEFYQSPAGARVLAVQSEVTEQIGDATEAVLEEHIEELITAIDEGLAAAFPELAGGEGP
jgi:hypothetical protein